VGHAPWSDWIDDLVSEELPAERRGELEAHLATCEACRAELGALRALRASTLGLAGAVDPPPGLEGGVRSALAGEAPPRRRAILLVAAAVALAVAGAVLWQLRPPPSDLPADALRSYVAYREGRLPLAIRTADERVLGHFFLGLLDFRTRVIDLGMMGYELVGGRVYELGGRPSALSVYEAAGARVVVCQMVPGSLAELPPPDRTAEEGSFSFRVYGDGPRTAVFWLEGAVLCVLLSEAPWEEVLDLARRKAMA